MSRKLYSSPIKVIWASEKKNHLETELKNALSFAQSKVWIISPFLTKDGMEVILSTVNSKCDYRLITRLNDKDILMGILDPDSIADFIDRGGKVRFHDRTLHAKLWIFDKIGFIGSANITGKALSKNTEIMVAIPINDQDISLLEAYDTLWERLKGSEKTSKELRELKKSLEVHTGKRRFNKIRDMSELKDYGKSPIHKNNLIKRKIQAWLKINGLSQLKDRIKPDDSLIEISQESGGETFSKKGRPRLKPDDIVILSHLGRKNDKNDYCIYGRGVVDVEHRIGIDEVPSWLRDVLDNTSWKLIKRWPYIVWLRDVQIVNGLAKDAPWLSDINKEKTIVKPLSLRQKSHIKIDEEQLAIFKKALDKVFEERGYISIDSPNQIWWNGNVIKEPKDYITRHRLEAEGRL